MNSETMKMPSAKRKHIMDLFSKHISAGQVRYLRAGYLDTLEVKRSGAKFVDGGSGRELFDAFASAGCFNVGRCNPDIIETLVNATDSYDMGSQALLSHSKLDFAKKLITHTAPELKKVLFSGGGGEAIGSAIKLTLGATGKNEVIAMRLAYHGHSGFALSVAGKDYYKDLFRPLIPSFKFAPFNDIEAMRKLVSEKTAAIILEPIQGEGGIHVADNDYLKGLRALCDERGIILIFDEIQTGFGRTGKLWCYQHSGVVPDIMVLAKSISGGLYPNAAIVYRDKEIFARFIEQHPAFHLSAGGGSDLACRISSRVIDYLIENNVPENAARQGETLINRLRELQRQHPRIIKEVRGKGMMLAMEYKHQILGSLMSDALIQEGMYASASGNAPQVMRFMLCPTMPDQETDEVVAIIQKAVAKLSKNASVMIPISKVPFLGRLLKNEKFMVALGNLARKEES